jgi:hypothetical protein
MKLFSFFAKMFGPKPQAPVTIAEEFIPVVQEQPIVIVPEEESIPKKKKAVKKVPKTPSL